MAGKTNKEVKFGLCNVHVAKLIEEEDGTITYDKPFPIPGGVTLSLDAEGDNNPFYADNIVYFDDYANNGYSGELEIAKLPDQFLKDILGQKIDSIGGIVENVNDKISKFALMYQIEGDKTNTRFCYYNTSASRPSATANTIQDTKTPDTDTLSITTSARKDTGDVRYKLPYSTENKTEYDKFFDAVPEPKTEASV